MKEKKELGLYLHIPFCEKKCNYCDFLSAPSDKETKTAYVDALIREIRCYGQMREDYRISTLFIGGGTPSSLEAGEILRIMTAVKEEFELAADSFAGKTPIIETTIETNPGTLDREKLLEYKEAGINRISMGLQSTKQEQLRTLGRIHTFRDFLNNYHLAREIGFCNINVDLMSALPGQTLKSWMEVLNETVCLKPEHISAYGLIIEEGTPFYELYGGYEFDEELDRQMYWETAKYLKENGYTHYEISNYAREGYECRHNLSYWIRKNYLGLGLGAASLINNTRFQNENNLKDYILNSGDSNKLQKEKESLDKAHRMEEFMFLGLRLMQGVNKKEFLKEFGVSLESIYGEVLSRGENQGLLRNESQVSLTDKGIDLSNMVMSEFLL